MENENKRFTLEWYARENLNLTEENQILKKENEALKECNAENSFMIDCFADEEVRLITENEELKKENQQLKEQILRWEHIACTGIHYNNILRQRSEKND